MSKKRYTLYLSRPLARKFDEVARIRNGAKSALVEEALKESLEPKPMPGIEDGLMRRLDELNRSAKTVERDVAIVTETLALFVRYFLTVTPPLPMSEQEPARILGTERFEVFVAEIGRRLASDHRLVSEVLETIAMHNPDLFATAGIATPVKLRVVPTTTLRPNGPTNDEGSGHG
ncbi:MAG: CopG family transcriptional regulator [Hyphomicrobium sp.]